MYLPNRTTITLDDDKNLVTEEPVDWVVGKSKGGPITIKGHDYVIKDIYPVGDDWKVILEKAAKA
jgi:hypothetical protein